MLSFLWLLIGCMALCNILGRDEYGGMGWSFWYLEEGQELRMVLVDQMGQSYCDFCQHKIT